MDFKILPTWESPIGIKVYGRYVYCPFFLNYQIVITCIPCIQPSLVKVATTFNEVGAFFYLKITVFYAETTWV